MNTTWQTLVFIIMINGLWQFVFLYFFFRLWRYSIPLWAFYLNTFCLNKIFEKAFLFKLHIRTPITWFLIEFQNVSRTSGPPCIITLIHLFRILSVYEPSLPPINQYYENRKKKTILSPFLIGITIYFLQSFLDIKKYNHKKSKVNNEAQFHLN